MLEVTVTLEHLEKALENKKLLEFRNCRHCLMAVACSEVLESDVDHGVYYLTDLKTKQKYQTNEAESLVNAFDYENYTSLKAMLPTVVKYTKVMKNKAHD